MAVECASGKYSLYAAVLMNLILSHCCVSMATMLEVEQLDDNCGVLVNGRVINLKSLGEGLSAGLTAQFGDGNNRWNYTYRPCLPFNMPLDPAQGFGDKCIAVSFCKSASNNGRQYYFTLGFQHSTKFLVDVDQVDKMNVTHVKVAFEAYRSMKGKTSYIKLVCDKSRTRPEDALFQIMSDNPRLGDVTAELHHVCCCLDGCPMSVLAYTESQMASNGSHNASDEAVVTQKSNKMENDRTKVFIVVGVNIGVFLLAGLVGMMCYNKRSVRGDFYTKVPGIKSAPEPSAWQLTEAIDTEKSTTPLTHPLPGSISLPVSPKIDTSARDKYRDGAPQIHRRKSFCFPVLEHSIIPEECITLGQRLGGGIFGDTYIGDWTSVTVAVKRVTLSVHKYQLDTKNILQMQEQVAFLSTQRHRNIVSVLGFCSESKHPYIISEFISGQVVKDFIRTANLQITWPDRVKMLSQIADGMAFLHSTSPPILHRDLRCGNLFITNNDVIKICDFGVVNITQPLRSSCQAEDCCCQGMYSACPPSIAWTAPEVLKHPNCCEESGHISTACDVYSYGIVMWELVMCDDPYQEMNTAQEVMTYVKEGGRPEIPRNLLVLQPYRDLMQVCCHSVPEERYNFKEVTAHLKELLYQAKHFQKMLTTRLSRSRNKSTVSTGSFSRLATSIERSLGRSVSDVTPETTSMTISDTASTV